MDVVLCWHMHQPDYRLGGRYLKPWTWLHAVKDYSDMAAHLETVPGARAVVNFSPVLIEQLQDYPRRIRALLERGQPIGDDLLDALGSLNEREHNNGESHDFLAQMLRVNEARMKPRFAPYARLAERARAALAGGERLSDQESYDLLVWYLIAWLGESLRGLPAIEGLTEKGGGFSRGDRLALLALVADVVAGILPRYRKLAELGTVELSVSPYAHPILPLLLDFESARESTPHAALPAENYPGGEARCDWHLDQARRVFEAAFGMQPGGCWPSEGALSQASLRLLARHGFHWTASGSQVLHNSLSRAGEDHTGLPQLDVWRPNGGPACFFRDDGLSDLIGFEYSRWPARDAVADFVSRLEQLRERRLQSAGNPPVLSIIMDGENAWEYYPENAWPFLQELYRRLAGHPDLRLTTFSEALRRVSPRPLPPLCAGSWVHGSLATWIGDPGKNHAWEQLIAARRAADAALEAVGGDERGERVEGVLRQLAICEASDWFWWLGEGERLEDAPQFDALFRRNLQALYEMLGLVPPVIPERPLASADGGEPEDAEARRGAMRRSAPQSGTR